MSHMRIIGSSTSLISSWTPTTPRWSAKLTTYIKWSPRTMPFLVTWSRSFDELFVKLVLFSPSYIWYFYSIVFEFFHFFSCSTFVFSRCRFLVYFRYWSDFSFSEYILFIFVWSVLIWQVVTSTADGFLFILKYWDLLRTLGWCSSLYFVWSSNGERRPPGV